MKLNKEGKIGFSNGDNIVIPIGAVLIISAEVITVELDGALYFYPMHRIHYIIAGGIE